MLKYVTTHLFLNCSIRTQFGFVLAFFKMSLEIHPVHSGHAFCTAGMEVHSPNAGPGFFTTEVREPLWWPEEHPSPCGLHACRSREATRNCRKSKGAKYWVRPVDGKRRGVWGRMLDGLTGEGPDVFVVFGRNRRSGQTDRPRTWEWRNEENPDLYYVTGASCGCVDCSLYFKGPEERFEMGWAKRQKRYNNDSRRYEYHPL
jgi:hypothetical protein